MSAVLAGLRRRLGGGAPADARPHPAAARMAPPDAVAFCRREGIPVVEVDSLATEAGVAAVRALRPDLAIHAGAGILREPILAVPRLGTLNAHMGLLPMYRGMNVAEWAALNGEPVGCTVHFIDPGIDTGAIVAVRPVDTSDVASIAGLRARVDAAQIALLGEVVRLVCRTGSRPEARPQRGDEGRQYFRMHPELRARLEAALRDAAGREAGMVAAEPAVPA